MLSFSPKVWDFVRHPTHSRTMGILVTLVLVSVISLTVIVAQQQQTTKQRAEGTYQGCIDSCIYGCQNPEPGDSPCEAGKCESICAYLQSSPVSTQTTCTESGSTCTDAGGSHQFPASSVCDNANKNAHGGYAGFYKYKCDIDNACRPVFLSCATTSMACNPNNGIPICEESANPAPNPAGATCTESGVTCEDNVTGFHGYDSANCDTSLVDGYAGFFVYKCDVDKICRPKRLSCATTAMTCAKNSSNVPVCSTVEAPTPTPTTIPVCLKSKGDANCDGKIDISDYEVWQKEFTKALTTTLSDFNDNGIIDTQDFNVWRDSYMAQL